MIKIRTDPRGGDNGTLIMERGFLIFSIFFLFFFFKHGNETSRTFLRIRILIHGFTGLWPVHGRFTFRLR